MSLSLNNVVNVQLNVPPAAAARRTFGLMALFTPEAGNIFNDASTLYADYGLQKEVEADFGTNSETAKASALFFSQRPRPKMLRVARWLEDDKTISSITAAVNGTPLTVSLDDFKAITNGRLSLIIDDVTVAITGLDFSADIADFHAVASAINTALPANSKITFIFDDVGQRFIVSAKVAGVGRKVNYSFDDNSTGTYIGSMMRLEDGQAEKIVGVDAVQLLKQTLPEAFAALDDKNSGWYAAVVLASLTDDQILAASNWIQAADKKVFGFTTQKASHLEDVPANIIRRLVDQTNDRTVVLYDKNDPYAIVSWLARALSVNFAANNSTITMKFKQLPGVSADTLTQTEANKCKKLGVNYYTYFEDSAMVAEGTVVGGRFFDEVHILDWFIDGVQKEVFTVLHQSPTKVPLTDAGTARLIAAVERVCQEGIKNGAFAKGVWTGDPFGTLETGDYLTLGFYVWADTVDNLSSSDRERRTSPPIQTAVKMAGAIHDSDVLINISR